jgi:D-lactate dehydrogenase (cytochrome)
LLDDTMMRGINAYSKLSYREAPTLFFEFHGTQASVAEQAKLAEEIAADHRGREFQWATAAEERTRLWHARDNTLYAGLGLKPGSRAVITDVCVPVSRLAECLAETKQDLAAAGLVAPIVGHVGDGNFHVLILVDPDKPAEMRSAKDVHRRMVERAIACDGTCTGEHGIGIGKMEFLEPELGEAVDVMRAVKAALDPANIMNPGKIFRPAPAAGMLSS